MRTASAPRWGRFALIRVVGAAEIVDSLAPLDAAALVTTRDWHRIPAELDAEVLAASWVHPWVLRDVRRLPRPVPAGQKPGQVIWVPLDPDTVTAIEAQRDGAIAPAPSPVRAEASERAGTTSSPLRAQPGPLLGADEVTVTLTEGATRNGNLSVRNALHVLPGGVVGGSSRDGAAARRLTVLFHPGETAETDIAGDKMLLRCRGAVADFYARSGAKAGDRMQLRRDRTGQLHARIMC
jgi:hypothetical protein